MIRHYVLEGVGAFFMGSGVAAWLNMLYYALRD